MTTKDISNMTVEQLVSYFSKVGVQQHDADGDSYVGRYNRLVEVMLTIARELRAREGDQRQALTQLYTHPNAQVRFMAAIHTLALSRMKGGERCSGLAIATSIVRR